VQEDAAGFCLLGGDEVVVATVVWKGMFKVEVWEHVMEETG
jgi:hypothetical protein